MANQYTSSNEFVYLVNQLQKTPEDPSLKQKIIRYLPYMHELAKKNPLALFHLAHAYPENSEQYKKAILSAAEQGCTNAMLAAYQFLSTSKNPDDQEKALFYLEQINQSNDSFIIDHSKAFLAAQNLPSKTLPPVSPGSYRFFTHTKREEENTALENQESYQTTF